MKCYFSKYKLVKFILRAKTTENISQKQERFNPETKDTSRLILRNVSKEMS